MTAADGSDINYVDGKLYTKIISLSKAGDNILNYRFYASDGEVATGPPTSDSTLTITNNSPTLSWTGESYYTADGVNPDTGGSGASFTFRISYKDIDNECPPAASDIQVWIDENDNNTYEAGEKHDMTAVDSGDTTCSDGKLYTYTKSLSYAGDGNLNYRFYAHDGVDAAANNAGPISDNVVTVTSSANNPPSLDWEAGACRTNGVKPAAGADGADFEFLVRYTDMDNECPPTASDIQVWIDENDNGTYEESEKYNLTEDDPGDTDCADGKLYKVTRQLTLAGDNILNFRFSASDGTDSAVGSATSDSAVAVVDALKVRTTGGTGWYSTIQSAIDAVGGAHTVMVYEGTYNENLVFDGSNDDFTTVQSVCGADTTIISGSANVVEFQYGNDGSVLDGFTITGGTRGVYLNGATSTIQNCKIHNNSNTGYGGGVYSTNSVSSITISNCEIYSNSAGDGGGIYFNTGTHTITNSIIRNNTATSGLGGGIFFNWTSTGTTVTNTTVKDNTAANLGAGLYFNGGKADFNRCTITGNVASSTGGAVYMTNSASTANFENCVIADNQGSQGGGIYVNEGTTSFINTTFADNQATSGNGGAMFLNCATTTVRNSIFWSNKATGLGNNVYKACGNNENAGTFTDSDITTSSYYFVNGTFTASNNIDPAQDPMFVGAGDYHIQSVSPVIDQANATYAPADDIDGDTRPQGSADDMGADEYKAANSVPTLSWTGEANYIVDGVNPDSAASGSSFVFRIDYTDAANKAPVLIQVWVDEDDNGAYSESEKYAMTEVDSGDTDYTDGKRYSRAVTLTCAGGCSLNYRFYASDGLMDATGPPTSNSAVDVTNNIPTLAWTGEANYTSDGVNPDSAVGGSSFEFRIDYTDADNTAPASIQVWVDEDDSGTYDTGEKYDMTGVDAGDTTYTDGKRYTITLSLNKAGDGSLNYRFYASDLTDDATGAPTSNKTVTVTNNVPTLSWTGEADFTTDGVNPDSGNDGSVFEFRIDYTDLDNEEPSPIQIWIDEDDNGTYEAGEKYDMTGVDAGDTTYSDGKRYSRSLNLAYNGDGILNYRFYASDGTDDATGTPASDSTVTVVLSANNAPVLAWTGETNYTSDGVDPDSNASGGSFTFRIDYTDDNNDAPSSIQVWIDRNDDGDYLDTGEQENMTEVDTGDTDYTDGKRYTVTLNIAYAGDGILNYRFYASDGTDNATGTPTSNSTITVKDPLEVPAEYGTIQAAIDASANGDYVIVSDGTYGENINFNNKAITVRSVNGAALTTIQGNGADAAVVTFNSGETASSVLDGFTIDNQATSNNARGIAITNSSTPTIKNLVIKGNTPPSWQLGAGIYINGGGATIENTTIGGSAADANSCGRGCAVYATTSSYDITITGSTLTYNTADSEGGAVYLTGVTGMTTITNSTIDNNSASKGGAIYSAGSPLSITNTSIDSNLAVYEGGGIRLNGDAADATITGGSISNNSATNGGGVYIENGADFTYTGGSINGNTASGSSGGGIYSANDGTVLTLTKTRIKGNKTIQRGGGIYFAGVSTATITNCTISGNTVGTSTWEEGGGVRNYSTLYIYSSTFAGNYAGGNGGDLYNSGTATVTNSIFWDNVANGTAEIYGTVAVTYSDVEGGYTGTGNINLDPLFVSSDPAAQSTPKTTGDYHIQSGSPVVDQGTATDAPADDIDGDSRPLGSGIDMGSDEKE